MSYRTHVRDRLRGGELATWTEDRVRYWVWEVDGVLVEAAGRVKRGEVRVTKRPRRLGPPRWKWVVDNHRVMPVDIDEVPEDVRELVAESRED